MPIDPRFRRTAREVVAGRTQREVAELTGVSQPYVNQVLNGRVPSREILVKLAEGLKPEPRKRAAFFASAGYVDDQPGEAEALTPEDVEFARGVRDLSPHQREVVRRLLDEPDQLDLIDQLARRLGRRVSDWGRMMEAVAR